MSQTLCLPSGLTIPDSLPRLMKFCATEYPYYDGVPDLGRAKN